MPVILYPCSFISFCFFMYCMLSLCFKLLVHEEDSDYIKCTFIIIIVSDAVSISEKFSAPVDIDKDDVSY